MNFNSYIESCAGSILDRKTFYLVDILYIKKAMNLSWKNNWIHSNKMVLPKEPVYLIDFLGWSALFTDEEPPAF